MRPLTFGRALSLGASAAFSRASPALLLGLAAAAGTLCSTLLWVAGVAALVDASNKWRFVGLATAGVVAWALEAAVLGGAVHQAAAAMRGRPVPAFPEAMVFATPRALPWAALAGAALWAWSGWQLLVGGTGFVLFLRGLLHGSGGVAGALGLALAATVGPLGALFVQLVSEMALVRAVVRDEPVAEAGWEAARSLLGRPWAPFGLLVLTGLLAAAVAGAAAAISAMGPPRPLRLFGGAALLQVAVAGLAVAVALLVRLDAFVALELGRGGELPEPPPPASVPRAELVPEAPPILEARAVGGPPETGG